MTPTVTFFPVGNGDMTLVQLESGRTILIDINIRPPDEDGEIRDVMADLRARLPKDRLERHYVDAMLLTHPDQDHSRGLLAHFHLGPLTDYVGPSEAEDGKIVIREMWSSPMVFRRRPAGDPLCEDAAAWATEARRRVKLHKAGGTTLTGDRIQVMGEDLPEKMEGIEDVVVKAGSSITLLDGHADGSFSGFLIAPKGKGSAAEEERRSKNHSSVIVRFSLARDDQPGATLYLAGGDALVEIWDRIWADHKSQKYLLEYHLLGAPHHCSWRSLSAESWSDSDGKAVASKDALKALGQALNGAYIVASSKPVKDDKDDPPCIGAKREYEGIVEGVDGHFVNTSGHKSGADVQPLVFEVTTSGAVLQEAGTELGERAAAVAKGLSAPALARRAEEANKRPETSKPQTPSRFA